MHRALRTKLSLPEDTVTEFEVLRHTPTVETKETESFPGLTTTYHFHFMEVELPRDLVIAGGAQKFEVTIPEEEVTHCWEWKRLAMDCEAVSPESGTAEHQELQLGRCASEPAPSRRADVSGVSVETDARAAEIPETATGPAARVAQGLFSGSSMPARIAPAPAPAWTPPTLAAWRERSRCREEPVAPVAEQRLAELAGLSDSLPSRLRELLGQLRHLRSARRVELRQLVGSLSGAQVSNGQETRKATASPNAPKWRSGRAACPPPARRKRFCKARRSWWQSHSVRTGGSCRAAC